MSNPAVLLLALVLDAIFGDPERLYRAVPHPIVLIGAAIGWLDDRLNRETQAMAIRRALGILAVSMLVAGSVIVGLVIHRILAALPLGWIVEGTLMSALIAQNSLYRHVAAVATALTVGITEARRAVGEIVGRDPESLDEPGVARAALESLAENFSDGVTAPLFWGLIGGLPGMLAYKAVNTADSMIGHRTERYEAFGWAAARLDDFINLLPARLAGVLLAVAAAFLPRADPGRAFRSMGRDAPKHRSPNAGWPEAALAGALGLALAGPRRYHGELMEDAWMGAGGRTEASAADIHRGLRLYLIACAMQAALIAAAALL